METPVKEAHDDKQHATTPSSLVSSAGASKSTSATSASSTKSRRRRTTAMRIPTQEQFQSFQSWSAAQCAMVARDLLFVGLRHSTWFGNLQSGGIGFYGYLQLLYITNSSLELSSTKQRMLIKQILQDYLQQTLQSIQLKYSSEFLNLTQPTLWNSDWMAAYVLNIQALLPLKQHHSKAKQLALFCLHKLEQLSVNLDSIQSCSIQTGLCGRIQFVLRLRSLFQDDKMGSLLIILCAKRILQMGMVTAEEVAAQERRRNEQQEESSTTTNSNQRLSHVQQTRLSFEQQASNDTSSSSLPLLWKSPEHSNAIVLGLSYGVVGILHTLLSLSDDDYQGIATHSPLLSKPNAIPNAKALVQSTIDTLMQYSRDKHSTYFYESSGNLKPSCSSTTSDSYVTVQHGMTGFVLLLLQASQIYQDASYFDYANELATVHVWPRGISHNFQSGLTTGTSGNALCMLLLAQACQDDSISFVWKRRCEYYVQSMILHLTESMTSSTSTSTSNKRFSLMHGMGGLLAVLLQLYSNEVEFPLLNMAIHTKFQTKLYEVPEHVWKHLTPKKKSSPTSTSSPDEQERLKRQTRRLEYAEQVAPSPSKLKKQQKLPHSPSTHSPGGLLLTSTPTHASTLNSIIPKSFERTSSVQRQRHDHNKNLPHYMQATTVSSSSTRKKRLTPSPTKALSPRKQTALSTVKRSLHSHFMTPTKASSTSRQYAGPATEPAGTAASRRPVVASRMKPRTLHYLTPTKSAVAHSRKDESQQDQTTIPSTGNVPSISQTTAMERLATPNRFKVKVKQNKASSPSPTKPRAPSQAQINAMSRLATPKKRMTASMDDEPPVKPTPSPRRRARTTPNKKKTPQQVLEGRQAFAARLAAKKESSIHETATTTTKTTSHVSNLLQSFQQLRNQPAKEKEESLEEQQRKAAEAASMDQMALLLEQKRLNKLEQDKQKLEETRRVEERKKEHAKLVEAQRQQEQASARALRAQQREATRLKIEQDKQQAALKKAEAAQKRAAEKERRDQLAMEKLKQREEQARKEASARKAAFAKARQEQDRMEQERRTKKAIQLKQAKDAQQQQAQANQKRAKLRQEAMEDARSKALQESQRRAKAQADAEDKRKQEAVVKKKRSAEELRLKKAKEQAEQQEATRIKQQAKEAKIKKVEQTRKKQQEDAARLEALRIQKAKEEEEAAAAEALRIQKEKDEAEKKKAELLRIQKEEEEAERTRIEQEKAEAERIRIEQEKAELERVEKEKAEAAEAARIQKEREEAARIQKEKEDAEAEHIRLKQEAEAARLEALRLKQEKEQETATLLQSRVRAFMTRKAFRRDVAAATKIQAATRAGLMRLNMKRLAEKEAQEKKRFEAEGKALEDGMKSATTAEDSPDLDKKSSSKASKWKKRLANKTKAKVSPSNSVDNEDEDDFVPESLRGMFEEADRLLSAEKDSILNDPALVGIRSMPSDEAAETPIPTIDSMPSDEDATSTEAQEMPAEKDSPQDAAVDVPAPSLAEAEVESDSVAETESPSKDEVTPTKKSSGRAAKWKARLGKKGSSRTPDTSDDETHLDSADVSKSEEAPAPTDSSPALTDEEKLLAALKQAKTSSEEQTEAAVKAEPVETSTSVESPPPSNLTMCSSCNIGRAKSEFSKAQLKKPASTRKCKSCVTDSVAQEEQDRRKAEEQARDAAEKEEAARLKAEEDRLAAEKAQAEEQARLAAEEEEAARLKAEEEAKVAAEVEAARIKAKEERLAAEKAKLEEEARIKADEEARAAAERAKAEEEARIQAEQEEAARIRAEEELIAKQKALEEEARLKAEQEEAARIQAEEVAEAEAAARLEAEKAKAEEERLVAEKKAKAEEEARLAAEKAKAEEERITAEKKAKEEDEARVAAEKAKAAEEARLAAEKAQADEEARLATETAKAEAARLEGEKKAKAEEEARLEAEKAKAEEEARLPTEKAKAEEEARMAAEKAKAEEERVAAEQKAKEEKEAQVAAEKAKAEEEARLAAEKAKADEEARQAAEAEVVRISMEKAQAAFEAEERRLAGMKEAKEKETQAVTKEVAKMYVEERRKSLESDPSVDSARDIAISESTDDDATPTKDAGSGKKKDRASKWKKRLAAKSGGKLGRKNSRDSSDDEAAVTEEATATPDESKPSSKGKIPTSNSDGEKQSCPASMEPNSPIFDGDNHDAEAQSEQDQSIDKPIDDAERSKKSDGTANAVPELVTQPTDEQASPIKNVQSPAAVVSQPTDEDADELMTPSVITKGILFDHSDNDDGDNHKNDDIGLEKIQATEADDDDKTSSNVPALSKDDEDFARSRAMALLAGLDGNDATSPSKASSNSDSGGGGIWGRLKQGASQAATQLDEATAKEGGIFGLGLRQRMGSKDEDLR